MIARPNEQFLTEELDRVAAIVQRRLGNQVRDFRMIVIGNGVVLFGQSATFHAKQLAQHLVMHATKLAIEANEIEVVRQMG